MINRLQFLRNIGQFDSVSSAATLPLARLTLVYAENGRGKTTLAAVLRSLATGDPIPIAERRRLAAQSPPHVVLECDGGPPAAMFENGAWNRTLPNMVVFDDLFVDQNVYSGLAVGSEHRQNLHELVLGAQGVALNRQLQQLIARIEEHNGALRHKAAAIPMGERGAFSVDDFCTLPARTDIDTVILATERNLEAARERVRVGNTPLFDPPSLPAFDIAGTDRLLGEDLPSLDAAAVAQVQAHIAGLGPGGETWINEGIPRVSHLDLGAAATPCPFCAQDLAGSPVISHYRAYFSDAYTDLRRRVAESLTEINRNHGGDVPAAFERAVRVAVERRQFWARFCDVPDVEIDTATITRDWAVARQTIAAAISAKVAAPLEHMTLAQEARVSAATYEAHRQRIVALGAALRGANDAARAIKEQAATAVPAAIADDLLRLRAVKARHTPAIAPLCDAYIAEKAAKEQTEQRRDQTRAALDQYRMTVFPGYQTAVNLYLQRFVAGFRLDSVTSAYTRGGPACTYNVIINNTPVAIAGGVPSPGEPSFRSTLSSGDRNTLALAFFFASLDQDLGLANKVVAIDDPISSLDDQRSLTTVQEMRRLAEHAGQVIVLSHNKQFLCRIWNGADRALSTGLQITRDGAGSTITAWDVSQDSVTEHDRLHTMLREYVANGTPNKREVARSIRHVLEGFLRVACPEHFPPGTLLGPFRTRCERTVGTAHEVLDTTATQELSDILEYAKRFHHETNAAWETETINDAELAGFVQRTLEFARR